MASQWFLDWNQRGETLIYLLFCTTAGDVCLVAMPVTSQQPSQFSCLEALTIQHHQPFGGVFWPTAFLQAASMLAKRLPLRHGCLADKHRLCRPPLGLGPLALGLLSEGMGS